MARTLVLARLLSALQEVGCGYSHPAVPLPTPSAELQRSEDADAGSEAHPLRVSGGVMAGQILSRQIPQVPNEVLKEHPSGTPVIAIVVDPTGRVVKASVVSGAEVLRPYYLDAVRHWTYKPFLLDGRPVFVATTVILHISYGALP